MQRIEPETAHVQIATCNYCKNTTIEHENLNMFFCSGCPSARRQGDDMSAIRTVKREEL